MASRGRPIIIEFGSKVRDFLRGTKKVERSTEDIADSLKDATKDAEKFEREFTSAMDEAARESKNASRKIEKNFDDTGGQLGDIGSEAGDEFVQNIGEAISSGDIEGLLQGTLGGLVGGLKGPIAAAAATLGGLAVIAFQQVRAEAEALTAFYESWQEAFVALVKQTADELTLEEVAAQYQAFLDENYDKIAEFGPLLDDAQIDAETFWKTLFTGGTAAEELLGYLSGIVDQGYAEEAKGGEESLIAAKDAAQKLIPEVATIVTKQEETTRAAQEYTEALGKGSVEAANTMIDEFTRGNQFIRNQAAIPIRQKIILDYEVRGNYLPTTNSTPYTPSSGASSGSRYRNSGTNRSP